MAKNYTTKTAIENYMLIDIDDSFDEQITEWMEAVEQYIDHETNRDFSVAEDESGPGEERVYDGDNTNELVIDPAVEITSLKLSATGDEVDSANYFLYPANKLPKTSIRMKNLRFPKGLQNIVVGGRFGYPSVPSDIKFAATVLMAGVINFAWQSEGEIQSLTIGRYSVTYKNDKEVNDFARVQEILKHNRKITF